jgi:hypothetical protein
MQTMTTIEAGSRRAVPTAERTPGKMKLALQSARILSWKSVLVQSLGRELHALHIQQQERAFMATTHGLNYVDRQHEITVVH